MTRSQYEIGEAYGGSAAHADPRSGIQEWEWVHTGEAFARQHPMGQLRGGMLLVLGYALVMCLAAVYGALMGVTLAMLVLPVYLLATAFLFSRSPAAYPLFWIMLVLSFPFSVPLVFYWADGVRPNLIYRHRFERLVRPEPLQVDSREEGCD